MTMVLTPLQLIQCLFVNGKNVWYFDGEVNVCFCEFESVICTLPGSVLRGKCDCDCEPANQFSLQELWQKIAFAAFIILLPVPFFVMSLIRHWDKSSQLSELQQEIRRCLGDGYADNRRWFVDIPVSCSNNAKYFRVRWIGISLLRRLILAIVSTTILDRNWRAMATTSLTIFFLLVHIRLKPFFIRLTHHYESVCLVFLSILSLSNSIQVSLL